MRDDRLLAWRLTRGDKEALRQIYEEYKDYLLTIAASLLQETGPAEDTLRDVFVALAAGAKDFYLYGSLRNYMAICVISRVRERLHRKMYEIIDLGPADSGTFDIRRSTKVPAADEESELISQALSQLSFQQREVIILHLQAAMTFREIANLQDISVNMAQARYHYGLSNLKSLLDKELSE